MDDAQLQVEALAPGLLSEDPRIPMALGTVGDLARPTQGKQEHQRGEVCQGRALLSHTEEHRMHAAAFQRQGPENLEGRAERGIEVEMQIHSKVIAY